MSKTALRCVSFKPIHRGSLRGFASITLDDLMMTIHGIGIHVHDNGSSWASPPAQPLVEGGALLKSGDGKLTYSPPLIEFRDRGVRNAWSQAVIRAVLEFDGRALDGGKAE